MVLDICVEFSKEIAWTSWENRGTAFKMCIVRYFIYISYFYTAAFVVAENVKLI